MTGFKQQILQRVSVIALAPAVKFTARILRMFAYGLLSVVFVLYLSEAGLSETGRERVPGLYPFPFSLLFGGRLQFIARLQPDR